MFDLPAWLLVFPILGFLVLIHEAAHFITAKWFGARVTEFGIGFPPRLLGFRFGETLYTLNLLPLGGFVKIVGEEDPSDPRSLAALPLHKRTVVIVSGSAVNLLLPVIILTALFMLPHDAIEGGSVLITGVAPKSPAAEAGLRAGDEILTVDSHQPKDTGDLVNRIKDSAGSPVELTVRRGAIVGGLSRSPEYQVVEAVTLVPRASPPRLKVVDEVQDPGREVSLREARRYDARLQVGDTMTQGAVGVMIALANPRVVSRTDPIWEAVPNSIRWYRNVLTMTWDGLTDWTSGSGEAPGLGPVGIAHATGEVAEAGASPVFQWVAFISIFLGITNLLPIPPLDGGRLAFIGIEWLRRGRRISAQHQGIAIAVGFALLLGFLVIVSYRDIGRILSGEGF